MRRIIAVLLVVLSIVALCACGTSAKEITITTVTELDGCSLTTVYYFDEAEKLSAVKQTAVYTESSAMVYDYSIIEAMTGDFFTDVVKTDDTISLSLTEKGMTETYPDATYSTILEMAREQELEIETSKQ